MSSSDFSLQMAHGDGLIDLSPLIKTNITLSFFSFFGSLTIILLFIFRKRLRSFVFNLVVYLSVSELLKSIGNIMSIQKLYPLTHFSQIICDTQAVIINYTDFCSLAWMCIISYTIYDLMINYNQDVCNKRPLFLVLGFGLPFVFTFVQAGIFYGSNPRSSMAEEKVDECWCWLYHMRDNWITVLIFYIFFWILIIVNFIVIWQVIKVLKSCFDENDKFCKRIKKMVYKLYMYPLVTGFCFAFATVHRMYQMFYIRSPNVTPTIEAYRLEVILFLLHGMFISIRGFIYFFLYGLDKKVKSEMRYLASIVYRCICRKNPTWFNLENYELAA